jgi:hypothetical protein
MMLCIDTVDEYKKSNCRLYDGCLDVAVNENWLQFHCRDCQAYEPVPEPEDSHLTALAKHLVKTDEDDDDDDDFADFDDDEDEDDADVDSFD